MVEEQENPSGLASDTLAPNHKSLDDNNGDVKRVGKSRHRKKALHASILKLMEFYFSDANLNKDRFLNKLIEANPYVDLSVFLKFNKIRNLTDETVTVLRGDEEKFYWDKMNKDRAQKFEKKNRKENKQRGRDKLLKKAEKELGKNIRFDDV